MQVFFLNEAGGNVIDIENDLDTFYDLINCTCIDIVERKCGDTYFDIICDDEGLLKDNPRVSAVDMQGNPMLVGNLIFTHTDDEGETVEVTDEDVATIMDAVGLAVAEDGRLMGMVVQLDY